MRSPLWGALLCLKDVPLAPSGQRRSGAQRLVQSTLNCRKAADSYVPQSPKGGPSGHSGPKGLLFFLVAPKGVVERVGNAKTLLVSRFALAPKGQPPEGARFVVAPKGPLWAYSFGPRRARKRCPFGPLKSTNLWASSGPGG